MRSKFIFQKYPIKLIQPYKFRHNLAEVKYVYNTRQKENINVCVPFFKNNLGQESSVSTANQLCRQLNINIYNFKNVYSFKLFLKTLDFTYVDL